jgi:hypothetical protein
MTTRTPLIGILFILALVSFPLNASAASTRPSCSLTVTTPRGEVEFRKKGDVLLIEGEQATLSWESTNATKAVDNNRHEVALSGSTTLSTTKNATYSYRFSKGSKSVTCSVRTTNVRGSIDADSLVYSGPKPEITGEAEGVKTVLVSIKDEKGKRVFKSKTIKVKRGTWEAQVTKSLPVGVYEVTVSGPKDLELNTIATGTLTILAKGASTGSASHTGSLAVSMVPFLTGGMASPGASVPVAYIKVSNTGTTPADLSGFTLKQNGSAPQSAVIGFVTSDDKGGSRATIGGSEGSVQFKNGKAFVPLQATLAVGQFRIFTIKALISSLSGNSAGTQLMIDVDSVSSTGGTRSAFPIRGTTWTLTR